MKRALTIVLLLSLAAHLRCETRVLAPATPEGLVGVWEALIPDGGSMASGVFVMVVSPQGDANLIEMYSLIGGGVSSHFFGSAPSIQLHDGKLKVDFSVHPDQHQICDWIEIEGSASVDGDLGAIVGKRRAKRGQSYTSSYCLDQLEAKRGRRLKGVRPSYRNVLQNRLRFINPPEVDDV